MFEIIKKHPLYFSSLLSIVLGMVVYSLYLRKTPVVYAIIAVLIFWAFGLFVFGIKGIVQKETLIFSWPVGWFQKKAEGNYAKIWGIIYLFAAVLLLLILFIVASILITN